MVVLLDGQCSLISVLGLKHPEDIWEHARRLFELHTGNLLIAIVEDIAVFDSNVLLRGPNLWDGQRMRILGRIMAKRIDGKFSLVERGGHV